MSGGKDRTVRVWNSTLQPISFLEIGPSQSLRDGSVASIDVRPISNSGSELVLLLGTYGTFVKHFQIQNYSFCFIFYSITVVTFFFFKYYIFRICFSFFKSYFMAFYMVSVIVYIPTVISPIIVIIIMIVIIMIIVHYH